MTMTTSAGVVNTSYLSSATELERYSHVQFNDMRMPQYFEVLNLPLDPSRIITRFDLVLVDELQRDLMSGDAMFSHYLSAPSR